MHLFLIHNIYFLSAFIYSKQAKEYKKIVEIGK